MEQEPVQQHEDAEFTPTPEQVEAVITRMAATGELDHMLPDIYSRRTKPFEDAGVNLRNPETVHAILVGLRLVEDELDRLTTGEGKDLTARLTRSVARLLVGQACDGVRADVVSLGYYAV